MLGVSGRSHWSEGSTGNIGTTLSFSLLPWRVDPLIGEAMAESRKPGSMNLPSGEFHVPARTCGPLGFNDQADPNLTTLFGDTPGPVGMNDNADPSLSTTSSWAGSVFCLPVCAVEGVPLSMGLKEEAAEVTLNYGKDLAKLPEKAEKVLKEICRAAGVTSVTITSTTRTPSDQARIMYDNIVSYGVDSQKKLYGSAGDKVIDVYAALKKAKKTPEEIKAGMEKKIIEVGAQKVSKHCADSSKVSVFDVAPSSVPAKKKEKFKAAVSKHKSVGKFLYPPGDPAYHIEINL